MAAKDIWVLLKETVSEWLKDRAPRLGAALAYYTVFSIAPLLVIVVGIAGLLFHDQAQHYVVEQIQGLMGKEGGEAIQALLKSAHRSGEGIVATVLGLAMLVFGAVGLFAELQDALNTIWGVQPKPDRGILGMLKDRVLSFSMVLGIAFLLLVSLVVNAALAGLGSLLGDWQTSAVGHVVNGVVSLVVITLLFAMIFRFLPDAKIAWRDVWLGAVVTAVLFTLGKFLIGLYLGGLGVASAYGSVGSLAVLLIWLYYSGQIFLFGAELTKVYANHYGSRIVPAENAEPVTDQARAEQGLARRDDDRAGAPSRRESAPAR